MVHKRRAFLVSGAAAVTAGLLEPVRAAERAAKPVRIRAVDTFSIEIPTPDEEVKMGKMNRYSVVRVETDAGVRGYSFAGSSRQALDSAIRPMLVGKDLFAVEQHLKAGLVNFGGVEHAVWDAIGKIAGQPVYRLLGGSKSRVKAYLTCVWQGKSDQSHVPYKDQADMAVKIQKAGFKGMKIRAWRPNPTDDADACGEIRAAVGPEFAIMFDRTGQVPERAGQKVWSYEIGLRVARALEKHGANWLEEPFHRDDFLSPARLHREVDITITGGEGFRGLHGFREALVNDSYEILQPDCVSAGGIFTVRKIAAMADAFNRPVIMHGAMGLRLAGWIQASCAIGAPWQEFALVTPPLLPEEQWSPALKIVNSSRLFNISGGEIEAPPGPGLGLDINEEALNSFRVVERA